MHLAGGLDAVYGGPGNDVILGGNGDDGGINGLFGNESKDYISGDQSSIEIDFRYLYLGLFHV